jgi:indole-3-glycerol phosphate synthase
MSTDFLAQMAASSRERLRAAQRACPDAALLAQALASPTPPLLQRSPAGFDLIAELKLRSPAAGQLASADADVAARVTAYAQAGAAAVSVLTEPSRFGGTLAHLEIAARSVAPLGVPVMRKDFLVDPYQVSEARLAGAGGVLVVLRMLPPTQIEALLERARTLELFVLLEAFDEHDIELMHEFVERSVGPPNGLLAGVNCRDLATLQVIPARLEQLVRLLPTSVPRVAESGVGSVDEARRVAQAGYDMALVGSALMQGDDPQALASAMLQSARAALVADAQRSGSILG